MRLASILSPMSADVLGLGTDEVHAVLGQYFGKARILRKKAITRMHRIGAGDLAGRENGWDVEVAVLCRGRSDAHALVGKPHMHGIRVGGGMHGDGRYAELLAGAQHPECDLAAVGDQDLVEHSFRSPR